MHNLHFIRVKASSAQEAIEKAESYISDFGNENNWRDFGGAISASGEVFDTGQGRFTPSTTNIKSFADVEACLNGWISEYEANYEVIRIRIKAGLDIYDLDHTDLYRVAEFVKWRTETKFLNGRKFSLESGDTLFDNEYHDEGLTEITYVGEQGEDYIVFVDMHS